MQAANSELGLSRKRGAEHDPFGQNAALHQCKISRHNEVSWKSYVPFNSYCLFFTFIRAFVISPHQLFLSFVSHQP